MDCQEFLRRLYADHGFTMDIQEVDIVVQMGHTLTGKLLNTRLSFPIVCIDMHTTHEVAYEMCMDAVRCFEGESARYEVIHD